MAERVRFDTALQKWFKQHPRESTTVIICDKCGLAYKPILGHKCKKRVDG